MNKKYSLVPDKMIDITRPLSENTPFWPGDEQFSRKLITVADGFITSGLRMSSHSGTHMDAPAHLAHCNTTVDSIPLMKLILEATVVDCDSRKVIDEDALMEAALEVGADDVVSNDDGSLDVMTSAEDYLNVKDAMLAAGFEDENSEVTMQADNLIELDVKDAEKILRLVDVLEDLDDVQSVYSNADISEEVLAQLEDV